MTTKLDQLLVESQVADLTQALKACMDGLPEADGAPFRKLFDQLQEELSSGDWTRIGVVTGLLWYKFDTLANLMKENNEALRAILRELQGK